MSPLLTTFAGASVFNYGFETSATASDFELIATTLGTGASNVITFSSIPSTYRHLQVRYFDAQTSAGGTFVLTMNGSGSTYYSHSNYQNNGVFGASATGVANIGTVNQGSGNTSIPAVGWFDILDYASTTKNKTYKGLSIRMQGAASTNEVGIYAGAWYSTAAITSLTITGGSNFATMARISLYGLKG